MDQHSDPGFARLRVLLHTHPKAYETVKTASFDYDERALPPSSFAWPAKRRFPIHNEKQAALSWLYAKDNSKVPSEVKSSIKEALEAYNVNPEMFEVALQEKVASAEDCLFPENGTYPVRTAAELKYAEARMLDQVWKMSPARRAETFVRLYEKSAALDVPLTPQALRYAGMTQTDPGELIRSLQARAGATKMAALQQAYEELAHTVRRSPTSLYDHAVQVKLASAIDELDQQADLQGLYDKHLPDPIASVFNTTKLSEEMVDLGGRMVPASRLQQMPATFYTDALGEDVSREITSGGHVDHEKLMPVIESLPMDMKRNLASAMGVRR